MAGQPGLAVSRVELARRGPATRPTPSRRWPPRSPACGCGSSWAPTSSRSCPAGATPPGSSPPRGWPRCPRNGRDRRQLGRPRRPDRPRPRGLARRARDRRLVQHDPRADGGRAARPVPRHIGRSRRRCGGRVWYPRARTSGRRKDHRDLPARAHPGRRRRRGIEERQGHRDPRHAGPGGLHRLPPGLHGPDPAPDQGDRRGDPPPAEERPRRHGPQDRGPARGRVDPDRPARLVAHVFTPEARDFYRLDRLWREAPQQAYAATAS